MQQHLASFSCRRESCCTSFVIILNLVCICFRFQSETEFQLSRTNYRFWEKRKLSNTETQANFLCMLTSRPTHEFRFEGKREF